MTPLFKKMNLDSQTLIQVLNAPASFEPELAALEGVRVVRAARRPCGFALAFVVTEAHLAAASVALVEACEGDAVVWMAYPKASSKRYRCEFNRDGGWPLLGAAGFEPVRIVSIDEDWSALRFRRLEYIKTLSRNASGAISAAGRRRVAAGSA